jgi:hypothetical protein
MRTFVLALLALPGVAAAQLAPDSPRLISPHGSGGLGVHWVRAETLPGDDAALIGTWAMPGLPAGMRLRGGAGKGAGGVNAAFGGIDYQRPLMRAVAPRRFDLDWQSGVGVSIGDYTLVTIPVGLTGGVSWTSGTVWMAPYVTAGVAADLRIGDQAPAREFEVNTALDVGLDLSFDIERKVVLRAAAALGDRQAVSLGLALGLGRLKR